MISIVNCGLGNVASVLNMLKKCGAEAELVSTPEQVESAHKVVLPGVGAFDHGIERLEETGMFAAVQQVAALGTPILGICLGMELLGLRSEEGSRQGLGLIDAEFRRFRFPDDAKLPVPHVGWNTVRAVRENPLIPADGAERRFYFVHSYYAAWEPDDSTTFAVSSYGFDFTAAYARDSIFGVQFHPEKSHRFGLELMSNFVAL